MDCEHAYFGYLSLSVNFCHGGFSANATVNSNADAL